MGQFTMTPAQVRDFIVRCFETRLVPFVKSSPGMGKSAIVKQIANDFNLELIDLRLSQCAPEDLMGLPMRVGEGKDVRATFAPFITFPTKGDPLPEGKNGWLLFLDEMNSATKMVQAAAYKLLLDRMVGQAELHEDVYVAAAGNLATDRAIVNNMSTATQTRIIHAEMTLDHQGFMDWGHKNKLDSRVLAFLEFQPSKLHVFKPDHTDNTFPCPRTWEFVSRMISGLDNEAIPIAWIAGTVGEGVALEFMTYVKVFDRLPSYRSICADPEGVAVPTDQGLLYATLTMLADKFTRSTFPDVVKFVDRLPAEFKVLYCRNVQRRDPKFGRDRSFVKLKRDMVKYLTEEEEKILEAA